MILMKAWLILIFSATFVWAAPSTQDPVVFNLATAFTNTRIPNISELFNAAGKSAYTECHFFSAAPGNYSRTYFPKALKLKPFHQVVLNQGTFGAATFAIDSRYGLVGGNSDNNYLYFTVFRLDENLNLIAEITFNPRSKWVTNFAGYERALALPYSYAFGYVYCPRNNL